MRRSLSYVDAVRMLGDGDIALVRALDRVSASGLFVLPGFDIVSTCREIVRLGDELLTRLGERLNGLDRMTRTERLRAAHAIIVLTAYFDVLDDFLADLPSGTVGRLSKSEQVSLASGGLPASGARGITEALVGAETVSPGSLRSHESMTGSLTAFYADLSRHVLAFLSGLAAWEGLPQAQRTRFQASLHSAVPALAVAQYEDLFRRLAADCPEFQIWAHMADHQATRAELRTGLAGLETLLRSVASGRTPDDRRAALARTYRAALQRPIAPSGDAPADLVIPSLGEGYIDHRFRVAEVSASSEPGRESWWAEVPTRADICGFLAGYLTSAAATEAPLIMLGQPGSGKSVLTRIMAARLPASDFLPVRVELRQVPAEADLQTQIESAVRDATGESLPWPRLVESGDGALPVVLLDGFDELLQATGVTQTDFLLRVLAFQEREADQGRPVAVIVTSRTAVTNRARIPHGAIAVRLEPFDDDQVTSWLSVWTQANDDILARRGGRALPASVALRHRELAEQPLLLLMLALYDADANALQGRSGELGQTELYERLLGEFARREIRKHSGELPDPDLHWAVENELLRLSFVAFAMFNRRSQWVAEGDLDADLSVLLGGRQDSARPDGLRAGLSAAQLAVGRFFFVHESQATRDFKKLQTYEFLHATFGEFLVARLVAQVMSDMVTRETAAVHSPLRTADDSMLHALLSFAALTARAPILAFLADLLDPMENRERGILTDLLLRLHSRSLYPRTDATLAGYEPLKLTATARHAAWSTNLVVLAVLAGREITGAQLFPGEQDLGSQWRNQAMMWRSQLSSEECYGLYESIALDRFWRGSERSFCLRRRQEGSSGPDVDMYWTYNIPPGHPDRQGIFAWAGHTSRELGRKSNFTCGKSDDFMVEALMPFGSAFPTVGNVFVTLETGRPVSATHALLAALVAPYQEEPRVDSPYLDLALVTRQLASASNVDSDYTAYLKTAISVLVSAVEGGAAPPASLLPLTDAADSRADEQLAVLMTRVRRLLDLSRQP